MLERTIVKAILFVRPYVPLVVHAQMVQDIEIHFAPYDTAMFLVSSTFAVLSSPRTNIKISDLE